MQALSWPWKAAYPFNEIANEITQPRSLYFRGRPSLCTVKRNMVRHLASNLVTALAYACLVTPRNA